MRHALSSRRRCCDANLREVAARQEPTRSGSDRFAAMRVIVLHVDDVATLQTADLAAPLVANLVEVVEEARYRGGRGYWRVPEFRLRVRRLPLR